MKYNLKSVNYCFLLNTFPGTGARGCGQELSAGITIFWPGLEPGMGINPSPAPGIQGSGNPGRFLFEIEREIVACIIYFEV